MKNKKIIGLILTSVVLICGYFFFVKKGNFSSHSSFDFNKVFKTRLQETLGYEVNFKELSIDKVSQKLVVKDLSLSLEKGEKPFLVLGRVEGILPTKYDSLSEIIIEKLEATDLSLPTLEDSSESSAQKSDLYRSFYNLPVGMEFVQLEYSKKLQKRFTDLKLLMGQYELTKKDKSFCKNKLLKSQKCKMRMLRKEKLQEKILGLVNDYSFFDASEVIKSNPKIIETLKLDQVSLFQKLNENKQIEIANTLTRFMKVIYDAQFVKTKRDNKIPHLTINEIFIREKLSPSAPKELVGSFKKISSLTGKMEMKTVFRAQGDLDKYKIKGISFRMVLHKGKNNAVSINSSLKEMELKKYSIYKSEQSRATVEKADAGLRVKTFIFSGDPKGSVNIEYNNLKLKEEGLYTGYEKLKSFKMMTNFERKKDSDYTDVTAEFPKSFKLTGMDKLKKLLLADFTKALNSHEEMLKTYNTFLKGYLENIESINEQLVKHWPDYTVKSTTSDIQQ